MKSVSKKYQELNELKGKIRAEGQNYREIAGALGMGLNTFCNKINGISEFTCSEIGNICKLLGIEPNDIVRYFFPSMYRQETKAVKGV